MKHIKIVLALLVVVVVFTGLVFFVESYTTPQIQERLTREANEAKFEVLPTLSDAFDLTYEVPELTDEYDLSESTILSIFYEEEHGYIYEASFLGYQSIIRYMVGIDEDGSITGYKTLEQGDTPGLGAEINNPEYWTQFTGMSLNNALAGNIDGLTGATVTTDAWKLSLSEVVDFHLNTVLGFVYTDVTSQVNTPGVTKAEEMSKDGTVLEVTYNVEFESQYSDGPNVYTVTFKVGEGIKSLEILEATDTESFGGHIADPEFAEQFDGMSTDDALNGLYDDLGGATYPVTLNAFDETFEALVNYHNVNYEGAVEIIYTYEDITDDVDITAVTDAQEVYADGVLTEVIYTVEFLGYTAQPTVYEITFTVGEGIKMVEFTSTPDTPGLGAEIGAPAFTDQFLQMTFDDALLGAYDGVSGATITTDAFADTFDEVLAYHTVEYEGAPETTYVDITNDVDVTAVTDAQEVYIGGVFTEVIYTVEFMGYTAQPTVYEITFTVGEGIKMIEFTSTPDTPGLGAEIGASAFTDQFLQMTYDDALLGAYDGVSGATITTNAFTDTFDEVVAYHTVEYEGAPETTYEDITDDVDITAVTDAQEVYIDGVFTEVIYTVEFMGYTSLPTVYEITFTVGENIKMVKFTSTPDTPGLGAEIGAPAFTDQFLQMTFDDALLGAYDGVSGATITTDAFTETFEDLLAYHTVEYEGYEPETFEEMVARYKEEVSVSGGTLVDVTGDYDITDTYITSIEEVTPNGETEATHLVVYFEFPGFYGEFGDYIHAITGINLEDGKLNGLRIVYENETDGIGSRILEEDFLAQFDNLNILGAKYGVYDAIAGASTTTGTTLTAAFENIITWYEDVYLGQGGEELTEAQILQQKITNLFPTQFSINDITGNYNTAGTDVQKVLLIKDINEVELGYVFLAEGEGASYSGPTIIRYLIAILPDETFAGFELLEDTDTTGIADPYYLVDYANQFVGQAIEVDDYPIDGSSGATLTHNAILDSAKRIAIFFVEEVMGRAFLRPAPEDIDQATLALAFPGATQFESIYLDHPINDYIVNVYEAKDATDTLLGYVYVGEADGYGANPIQFAWGINVSGITEQIEIISHNETWNLAEEWASYNGSQGVFPNTPWLANEFEGIDIANITTTEVIDDVAGVSTTTSGMREAAEAIVAYHNANVGGGS